MSDPTERIYVRPTLEGHKVRYTDGRSATRERPIPVPRDRFIRRRLRDKELVILDEATAKRLIAEDDERTRKEGKAVADDLARKKKADAANADQTETVGEQPAGDPPGGDGKPKKGGN